MLILGLASAKMHQGNFEEAEVQLQEALNKVRVCCAVWLLDSSFLSF
jgi:Tfp pilus assembly protein PilF